MTRRDNVGHVAKRKQTEERVAESGRRFRSKVHSTTAGIVYADRTGRVLVANERLTQLLDWPSPDPAGRTIQELTRGDDALASEALFQQLVTAGSSYEVQRHLQRRDGTEIYVNVGVSPIYGTDGTVEAVVAVVLDATGRKDGPDPGSPGEDHWRLVLDSITDYAIITVDASSTILGWNVGAERLFGYASHEAIGKSVAVIFTPEDRQAGSHLEEIRTARATGRAADERWHLRKDGSRFYVSGVLTPVGGPSGTTFVKVARDLTDRKQHEETLQRAHDTLEAAVAQRTAQLRDLLSRLITVQEDERQRIARDLHDDIGQQMTALHLKLESLRHAHPRGSVLHTQVEETQTFLQQLDRDLDFFTWELRPAALYDLGLTQALRDLVAQWAKNFDITAAFQEVGLGDERLRADQEINLYRITQEALNNVSKHAQARHVDVVLQRRGGEVVVTIEDDGIGIDEVGAAGRGMGLVNMRERAALMQGAVEFEQPVSGGTTVIVRAPAWFRLP